MNYNAGIGKCPTLASNVTLRKLRCLHILRDEHSKCHNVIQKRQLSLSIEGIRQQLITGNLALALNIAGKYGNDDDIRSNAIIGLIRAIDKFNVNYRTASGKEVMFSTYAYKAIFSEIYAQYMKDKKSLIADNGKELGHGEKFTQLNDLAQPNHKDFNDILNDKLIVDKILSLCSDREKIIFIKRFGLDGGKPQEFKDIASIFGFTKQAINKNFLDALNRLKTDLTSHYGMLY